MIQAQLSKTGLQPEFENVYHTHGSGLFHSCLIFSVVNIVDPANVICRTFRILELSHTTIYEFSNIKAITCKYNRPSTDKSR